jgi:hypothetical protein
MQHEVRDRDEFLANIIDQHKDDVEGVSILCENLVVKRNKIIFDMSTVIKCKDGKRYKVTTESMQQWYRGKGNTLTFEMECPFKAVTVGWA